MALLEVRGVDKRFGGVPALSNVTLSVNQGEIVGLIGPNGAGKTTLFNVITGFLRCDSGKVILQGQDVTGLRPHVIARKGIVRTFQQLALWRELTVAENVRNALFMRSNLSVAGSFFNTSSYRSNVKSAREDVTEILKFVGMEDRAGQKAKNLSHGYQKTLSLAIGLATQPTLLLLDEPLAALNPERCLDIVGLMRMVREKGSTILVIEHNMRAIFDICDRIVVLSAGANIATGSPAEIRENQQVIAAYLGGGSNA